jgi:hypothetical protein
MRCDWNFASTRSVFHASGTRSLWRGIFASALRRELRGFVAELSSPECTRSPVRGCPCRRLVRQLGRLADGAYVAANLGALGEHREQTHSALAVGTSQNVNVECALQKFGPWAIRAAQRPLVQQLASYCTMHASYCAMHAFGFAFRSDRLLFRCDLRPQLAGRREHTAYRTVCKHGYGTAAARRDKSESGSMLIATVTSRVRYVRLAAQMHGIQLVF